MRLLFLIILSLMLLFISCTAENSPIHGRLIDRLMSKFVSQVKKDYNVNCFGSGGAFMDQINEVYFSFDFSGSISQSELRNLIVNIAEDFLRMINNDQKIRDYLANYPFTVNNLRFSITLVEPNNRSKAIMNKGTSNKLLCHTLLAHGKITYAIKNEEKVYYQKIYEESYDEAYGIVRGLQVD